MKVKVSVLAIKVLTETRRTIPKVLKNDKVEKLVITAPCTFNANLVMENLKEVELNMISPVVAEDQNDCCTYFRSKADDRKFHRPGLCIVNIGSVFGNCPKLSKFMGFDLTSIEINEELTFLKWNNRVKKMFFDDYIKQGGMKEYKEWVKSRWFSKRPVISAQIGKSRN